MLTFSAAEVERLRLQGNVTNNGIVFHEELAGSSGMSFCLIVDETTTKEAIYVAQCWIRARRDVVRFCLGKRDAIPRDPDEPDPDKRGKMTPGRWHRGCGNGDKAIFSDDGRTRLEGATVLYPICTMVTGFDHGEDEANAEAIADVPDMLTLLEECRAALPDAWAAVKCKTPPELLDRLNAMLKKHGK